jgi:hypothetical protein
LDNGSESSSAFWSTLQDWAYQGLQLIDLRLALAIGLITFLVVVGFDSAGNQAEAADLVNRASLAPSVAIVNRSQGNGEPAQPSTAATAKLPQQAQSVAAKRLRHGTLTSAVMTSSRLTQAHFFTELPSRP